MATTNYDAFRKWMLIRPSSDDEDGWVACFVSWCMHVPNLDMVHFHHAEWVEYVKHVLYSKMPFNPIRSDRSFIFAKNQVAFQLLPNARYRSLLLHIIQIAHSMSARELRVVLGMLMAMEENNITGFVHVPRVSSFRTILRDVASIYSEYGVDLDHGHTHLPEMSRIVASVMLCNTSVVFLINAIVRYNTICVDDSDGHRLCTTADPNRRLVRRQR
jgi:hypothetical protein